MGTILKQLQRAKGATSIADGYRRKASLSRPDAILINRLRIVIQTSHIRIC